MVRRTLVIAALALGTAALGAPGTSGATVHTKIHAHQYFGGSVNGSIGTPVPAVIKVVCPGPATLGQRGHPLAGQTVEVGLSLATVPNPGYTGRYATTIGVFFGPPPPATAGPGQVSFTRYLVPKAIPTSLSLPCSGTGTVAFLPFPESPPTSRSTSVTVEYANVAATSSG